MKILFVNPPDCSWAGYASMLAFEPLNLELLAASVQDQHEVRILDLNVADGFRQEMRSFYPNILCMGGNTNQVYNVLSNLQVAKQIRPDLFTITGGQHATFLPQDFARSAVDVIANGPAIPTLREIVDAYEVGKDLREVAGISLPANGTFYPTEKRILPKSLDDEPFPARHLTTRYRRRYHAYGIGPIAAMRTAEGCPFRCTFCSAWRFYRGKYRLRSPELVVEELRRIEEDIVFICDDDFLVIPDRIHALCEAVMRSGIEKKYWCFGRADFIVEHPDLVKMCGKMGLVGVYVGMEAATNEALAKFNKKTAVEMNTRAVEVLRESGISPCLAFIVDPGYSMADFNYLFRYAQRDIGLHDVGYVDYASLTPIPGSQLWDEQQGRLETRDYRFFDMVYPVLPTKLSKRDYLWQMFRLYIRTYWSMQALGSSNAARRGFGKKNVMPVAALHSYVGAARFFWKLLAGALLGRPRLTRRQRQDRTTVLTSHGEARHVGVPKVD